MKDRIILRELANQYAQIAALPIQQEHIRKWKDVYSLKTGAPTFSMDQLPWHELNQNDELTLRCEDPFARGLELSFRRTLYRWKHFPCDMVVTPEFLLDKQISNSGIGVESATQDQLESAETHLYQDFLPDSAALRKLHLPTIRYLKQESEEQKSRVEEYFGDILPVRLTGSLLWAAIWDRIVFWRGATPVLYDLADRPEFLHELMEVLVKIEMGIIDQYERENLFDTYGAKCHCLETYTNELPLPDYDENHIRAKDCWISGAAQIFSEVSPAMHEEFELNYLKPVYERFGFVNYGCCEPLHRKIDLIKKIKSIRAISASPWVNVEMQAEAMGNQYVMARKPNPSFLAQGGLAVDAATAEIQKTLDACRSNQTPVVFVLKDVTTVQNDPRRLTQWHDMVKEIIQKNS